MFLTSCAYMAGMAKTRRKEYVIIISTTNKPGEKKKEKEKEKEKKKEKKQLR